MATNLIEATFASTYKDDFKDSDNYHRILFNSGKVLQARELTQSQTIIQKEIERFGRNIFKEGALVKPGGITLDTQREFIKLNTASGSAFAAATIGNTYTATNPSGLTFKLIDKITGTNASTDPDTLIVIYTDVSSGTAGTTPIRVANGSSMSSGGNILIAAASNATGIGSAVSIDNSEYFARGHFIFVEKQTIVLEKYSSTPTKDIGFKVEETIVTFADETALYDNQGASPNLAAPGADRYRIRLTLTTRDQVLGTENFIYATRVEDGKIVDEINPTDDYNIIHDFMALRTKEESGDYIVRPFTARFNDLNDSNLQLEASSGIAYIDGYRADIPQKKITVPKARETLSLTGQRIVANYGNYIIVKSGNGESAGLPNIEILEKMNLRDAVDHGGSTIGTARVRSVDRDGSNNRFYLFDIQMNANQSFSSVKSIGTSVTNYADLVLEGGIAVLKSTGDNSLIFELPFNSPTFNGFSDTTYRTRHRVTATSSGSGSATFTAPTGFQFSGSPSLDYVISQTTAAPAAALASASFGASGSTTITVTGLLNSTSYELIATFENTAANDLNDDVRSKTLEETTITITWPADADTDANGTRYIDLARADIYSVQRVTQTDSDGIDLSTFFTLDNGQRDNFYAVGKLLEKPGSTPPNGDVFVRYRYFSHGTQGPGPNHFSVESYKSAFSTVLGHASGSTDAYKAIPSFTKSDGVTLNLRNVFDFRPVQDPAGNYESNGDGGGSIINHIPRVDTTIESTIQHYQQRKDKLVALLTNNEESREGSGVLQIQQGIASLVNPQPPVTPEGALTLYEFNINPFTLNESDISSTLIPHKRYTMKDIGRIEQRIDNLEETISLSLLEVDAESLFVLDSSNTPRTKSGFLADNFSNYALSDVGNLDYRGAINLGNKTLSAPVWSKATRLNYNVSDATDVTLKGDFALLDISSHETLINQNLATSTVNVNPFNVITSLGHIDLSPSSDDWVETQYTADKLVQAEDVVKQVGSARTFSSLSTWQSNWVGVPTNGNNIGSSVQVQINSQTIREEIGDKVVEVDIIPFMRSRKIGFRAQGLQPNARHFAFFGGQSVADFVKQESFSRFALSTDDEGNIYTKATQHPDTPSNLVSDAEGKIEGTFLIPSRNSLRFRTGEQEFKILNISADDEDAATSIAASTFISTGVLQTRQKTIQSTRHIQTRRITRIRRRRDPVAQSFRVDHVQNPNGIFLTKVDVFFGSKDTIVPVQLQIRPVENGVPTGEPIPGAVKFLSPSSVNTASSTLANVQAAPTNFEFEEPIYLAPGFDYAVVLLAETDNYTVHVAEVNEFLLGSTSLRVQKQPTMGSLFVSQNGRTWNPDQTKDLMFKLYRADFVESGNVTLKNAATPKYLLPNNPLLADSDSTDLTIFHEGHGFEVGDAVLIEGLSTGLYANVDQSDIVGTNTITAVDHTGYRITADSSFANTLRFGSNEIIVSQNARFDNFAPQIQTLLPNDTNLGASIKTTSSTSYGANSGVSRNSSDNNYVLASTFEDITLNEINTLGDPKVILSDSNETLKISGNSSFQLKLDLTTTDTRVSPVIDLQRASVLTFDNIIDNQYTSGNTALSPVADSSASGGTSAANHLSIPINLAEAAVGLKIILAANRPDEADFKMYYRVATSDEVLSDKAFILADKEVELSADNNPNVFRDYEYLIGGLNGTLDSFTKFQVKIVMTTTNSSRVPTFRDLRVIALAV